MRDANKTPPEIRYEWPDPNPIEAPVRVQASPNTLKALMDQARMLQLQALAQQQIEESYEEADDFDVDDFQGALEYGKTRWELAADAASLTPSELFERVYGVDHAQAFPPAPLDAGTDGHKAPLDRSRDNHDDRPSPKSTSKSKRGNPPPQQDFDGE